MGIVIDVFQTFGDGTDGRGIKVMTKKLGIREEMVEGPVICMEVGIEDPWNLSMGGDFLNIGKIG